MSRPPTFGAGKGIDPRMEQSWYAGLRSDKPRLGEPLVSEGECPEKARHIDRYLAAKAARRERDGQQDKH